MQNNSMKREAERRVMEDLLNSLLAEDLLDGLRTLESEDIAVLEGADAAFTAAWRQLRISLQADEAAGKERPGDADAAAGADDGTGENAQGAKHHLASPIPPLYAGHQSETIPAGTLLGLWRPDGENKAVVFGLRRSLVQELRCEPLALVSAGEVDGAARLLTPPELMRLVAISRSSEEDVRPEGTETFIDMLRQTAEQIAWSLERRVPAGDPLALPQDLSLLALERSAAFRDRPFHPVAKVKLGWGRDECGLYTAEAGQPIGLRWMAVRRDRLLRGSGAGDVLPQTLLLPAGGQAELDRELEQRGLHVTHMALPVHPWQMDSMLPGMLGPELEEGVCVPLTVAAGMFYATSSVRSLMSLGDTPRHVKLPLGIRSLGGLRYLSAIKLMNGERAESLLRQVRQLDPVLRDKLFLCEEGCWLALAPQDNDLFADQPRHLSAMIRSYPQELAKDKGYRLVPMSALAAPGAETELYPEWLRQRGRTNTAQGAIELFREIAETFGELSLRLLRFGLVPEAHGQNVVLAVKDGRLHGILLRDHDALRVHVPWLREAGLDDPHYLLRPGVPNSLYHDSPQPLIAFFQMLGVQINLFAIMDSLSRAYGLSEERLWTELKDALLAAVSQAGFTEPQESVVHACLFGSERWPWKQVVRPLLAQAAKVPGSMPYGKGEMRNPFFAAERLEVPYAAH
ncbi:IucA/IucC family protein [Paenibacillus sp. XY044]|uniref:IucA/IucC family protein n=1 Tax=Paenibacillus sp. XY044 TaxID=2026089 RepID=UPI000B990E7E|nr:IucA/IucC family protein [Paenibacillus sp. XY044]OZB95308.1 hypothetical protein CJP46_16675 [Paenibacillus sp. XY044]